MIINEKNISTKEELINLINEGVNPLQYIKDEKDIEELARIIIIEGKLEDPFWEEMAANAFKTILFYLIYTDVEEKTIERCRKIISIGLSGKEGKETIKNLFEKEERAKLLFIPLNIASDKTYVSILEIVNEKLSNI